MYCLEDIWKIVVYFCSFILRFLDLYWLLGFIKGLLRWNMYCYMSNEGYILA